MNHNYKSKIRIVIDLQGFQREGNRVRGIGRFSLELVKSLIKHYPENEYILFSNSSLYDFRNDFKDELNDKKLNIFYFEWSPVGEINEDLTYYYSKTSIACQLRSYALSLLHADIILLTSFFDGFKDNTIIDIDHNYKLPLIVSIIYDLIPLINPKTYLDNDEEYKYFYHQKILNLHKLDAILTISESSKNEILKYTKINSNQIYNISAACNQNLFNKDISEDDSLKSILQDLDKFILYTGAVDPRKNLYRLIKAYSQLPLQILLKHKLVLTGPYSDTEIKLIQTWIAQCNLSLRNIIILGFVSDQDLANLYKNCYLFVFPSLHEGFGLPVLEAMSCGAPVIASKCTSIPEIVNSDSALFNPYDIDEINQLILKILTDIDFYKSVKKNSKIRKKSFSWAITAKNTVESIISILESKSINIDDDITISSLKEINKNSFNKLITYLRKSELVKYAKIYNISYLRRLASSIDLVNNQSRKFLYSKKSSIDRFNWRVEGPFDTTYSLAILNRNFALALFRAGQDVLLHSTEGPGDFIPNSDFLINNPIINSLYQKCKFSETKNVITTRNLYPPRVDDLRSGLKLLHAYGWEESLFPQNWVNDFNNYLDGITVMSNQVKKILIDSGVSLPIRVCGLGVDHISQIKASENFTFTKKSYAFLHISSCFPRKGIDCLLKAYGESFTNEDDVSLIIKTFHNPHNNVQKLLEKYISYYPSYPHVNIIYQELNDYDIKSLYQQCDVLVAPSFCEGFNLTLAEAMKIGIPVITTSWGGQMDFCNDLNSWLLDYDFEYSKSHFNLFASTWAKPSSNHLAKLMKDIYTSSSELIHSKIESAKKSISQYTWDNVANINIDFIPHITFKNINQEPKIGWISTWKIRCGLATYSEHLLSEMKGEYILFTPNRDQKNDNNEIMSWNMGDDSLENLFEQIVNNNITSIVVQFNYGFFDFTSFSNFIKKIHGQKIKIIVFLHSTIDPTIDKTKQIRDLSKALSLCHRLLVHSTTDLNRLKNIGLVDNVTLFPHGILNSDTLNQHSKNFKYKKTRLHLSAYGFCLPNKGFPELIQAVNILRKNHFDCKLTLFTALYDSEISTTFHGELLDLIDNLNLKKFVKINSAFLTDEETLLCLSRTDLVVFPYQSTNESASGAVRQGISSLTSVAVTPLPIFQDVLDVVYQLPGVTPLKISEGIMDWYNNCYGLPITSAEMKWREQHSFRELGSRLYNLIQSIELNY